MNEILFACEDSSLDEIGLENDYHLGTTLSAYDTEKINKAPFLLIN